MVGKRIFYLIICFSMLIIGGCKNTDNSPVTYGKLTCEHMENPIGIVVDNPAFSWVIQGVGESVEQSACQIVVASSQKLLSASEADCWNSGKVMGSQSILNSYNGIPLKAQTRYYWKVKVWDQDKRDLGWSEPQFFETGLKNNAQWKGAKWIQLGEDNRISEHRFRSSKTERMEEPQTVTSYPVAYLRNEIELPGNIKKARAYICGLGYFELYINGQKIGDHVLDPAPTSYEKRSLYVIHDVSEQLKKGENTLGIILGNGFYGQSIAFGSDNLAYGVPAVRFMVDVEYDDGSTSQFISNESWKSNTGPIVFDNVYAGETYDARFQLGDWTKNGFDDNTWNSVKIATPDINTLASQLLPPMRKVKEIKPTGIFKNKSGNWIVDFGQNISGWVRIYSNVSKGEKIRITYSEALTRKGDALNTGSIGAFATGVEQISEYIGNGEGWQSWEPRFCYHGFQYVEIEGMQTKPSLRNVVGVLVHSDVEKTGTFSCSDPGINKMLRISEYTVVDNLHGIPEDCPHREKCGWLGDAHAVGEYCLYNFDMTRFYMKYQKDIQSQLMLVNSKKHKPVPLIAAAAIEDDVVDKKASNDFLVPTMVAPGKRKAGIAFLDWGIAEIYVPWYLYLHTGDSRLFKEHFNEMKQLTAYYLTFKNSKGYIANGLGDWCPPRWDRQTNPDAMECHPHISATAYMYDVLGIMEKMAREFGEQKYAEELSDHKNDLKKAFNENFLKPIDEGLWYGSQTATVMALRFGMVPEAYLQKVIDGLVYDIVDEKDTHHSCGIHGNRYIYTVLSELGLKELAHELLTTPTFPSMAYIANSGLTTWPERQWEWNSGIEWDRSLNHPMQAGFAAYFYESIAGIKPIREYPGYKKFVIAPNFVNALSHAKASVQTPYGEVVSAWGRTVTQTTLSLQIPFNTEAKIELPVNRNKLQILKNGESLEIEPLIEDNKTSFWLSAGNYEVLTVL